MARKKPTRAQQRRRDTWILLNVEAMKCAMTIEYLPFHEQHMVAAMLLAGIVSRYPKELRAEGVQRHLLAFPLMVHAMAEIAEAEAKRKGKKK